MSERVVVKNDIRPVSVVLLVGDKELVLDPNIYTADTEITVKETLEQASEMEEKGKKADAIKLTRSVLADIVLPRNPDWSREEFDRKITTQQIGWALGFFEILSPSGGRLARETVERIGIILTTGKLPEAETKEEETPEDSTSTTRTLDDPSISSVPPKRE